jgi:hypothetical protein
MTHNENRRQRAHGSQTIMRSGGGGAMAPQTPSPELLMLPSRWRKREGEEDGCTHHGRRRFEPPCIDSSCLTIEPCRPWACAVSPSPRLGPPCPPHRQLSPTQRSPKSKHERRKQKCTRIKKGWICLTFFEDELPRITCEYSLEGMVLSLSSN